MSQRIGKGAARPAAFVLALCACVVLVVTLALRLTEASTTRGFVGASSESNSAATARGAEEPQAIVFFQQRRGHTHFFAVTARGQRLGRLRTPLGSIWEQVLSWSPDHSKLAVAPIFGGPLYTMNADG